MHTSRSRSLSHFIYFLRVGEAEYRYVDTCSSHISQESSQLLYMQQPHITEVITIAPHIQVSATIIKGLPMNADKDGLR